jgi:hypothetical protein
VENVLTVLSEFFHDGPPKVQFGSWRFLTVHHAMGRVVNQPIAADSVLHVDGESELFVCASGWSSHLVTRVVVNFHPIRRVEFQLEPFGNDC